VGFGKTRKWRCAPLFLASAWRASRSAVLVPTTLLASKQLQTASVTVFRRVPVQGRGHVALQIEPKEIKAAPRIWLAGKVDIHDRHATSCCRAIFQFQGLGLMIIGRRTPAFGRGRQKEQLKAPAQARSECTDAAASAYSTHAESWPWSGHARAVDYCHPTPSRPPPVQCVTFRHAAASAGEIKESDSA